MKAAHEVHIHGMTALVCSYEHVQADKEIYARSIGMRRLCDVQTLWIILVCMTSSHAYHIFCLNITPSFTLPFFFPPSAISLQTSLKDFTEVQS